MNKDYEIELAGSAVFMPLRNCHFWLACFSLLA